MPTRGVQVPGSFMKSTTDAAIAEYNGTLSDAICCVAVEAVSRASSRVFDAKIGARIGLKFSHWKVTSRILCKVHIFSSAGTPAQAAPNTMPLWESAKSPMVLLKFWTLALTLMPWPTSSASLHIFWINIRWRPLMSTTTPSFPTLAEDASTSIATAAFDVVRSGPLPPDTLASAAASTEPSSARTVWTLLSSSNLYGTHKPKTTWKESATRALGAAMIPVLLLPSMSWCNVVSKRAMLPTMAAVFWETL
mmetsp:Transcript_133218/g.426030  ORF Transcript_133218/g.426030 Transcript_133218/m.426030 type:complete len:250 (+) Transcript_133218:1749-2498(+)